MPVGAQQFSLLQAQMNCQGAADVACAAAGYTTAMTIGGNNTAVGAISNDTWSPNIDITLAILLGATPPSGLAIAYALVAGTPIGAYLVPPAILVASATILVGVTLIGPASKLTWQSSQVPLVQVNPTGQAVTVKNIGSGAIFSLYMGGP